MKQLKWTYLCFIFSLCLSEAQAQLQVNFVNGINLSNVTSLNTLLEQQGYEPIPEISGHTGAEFGTEFSGMIIRFGYNFLYQRGATRLGNRNSTLTGGYGNFLYGFKLINRSNIAFNVLAGASITMPFRLRLINGNPSNNSFLGQIQNPSSQVNELDFHSPFYLHSGVEYHFSIKKIYRVGLRANYSVRLSRAEWQSGGKILSGDVPKINPISGQFSLLFGF